MKLSFGMIFSIILIAIFLAVAVFAIQKFLQLQETVQVSKLTDELQSDIDKIWRSSQGSVEREYNGPKNVVYLCFRDGNSGGRGEFANLYNELLEVYFDNENLFFYPVGSGQGLDSLEIKHIDIETLSLALHVQE